MTLTTASTIFSYCVLIPSCAIIWLFISPAREEDTPRCELHIREHLDETRAGWFEGLTITQQNDGTTLLAGDLPDQSALYGVPMKIHNLNLTLITMREIESDNSST